MHKMKFHFILNQLCILKDKKRCGEFKCVSRVEDIVAVPRFFACISYRPQRLKAPFVRTGQIFRSGQGLPGTPGNPGMSLGNVLC